MSLDKFLVRQILNKSLAESEETPERLIFLWKGTQSKQWHLTPSSQSPTFAINSLYTYSKTSLYFICFVLFILFRSNDFHCAQVHTQTQSTIVNSFDKQSPGAQEEINPFYIDPKKHGNSFSL